MSESVDTGTAKLPWHYWAVGGLAALWNGYGAYDFSRSMTRGNEYLQSMGMNEAQIAFFNAMPGWMYGAWAIGVWGAVGGTVLYFLRSQFAMHFFAASLLGSILSLIYSHFLTNGAQLMGEPSNIIGGVITIVCMLLTAYAWKLTKMGALR